MTLADPSFTFQSGNPLIIYLRIYSEYSTQCIPLITMEKRMTQKLKRSHSTFVLGIMATNEDQNASTTGKSVT
jgi:hypothetical protein